MENKQEVKKEEKKGFVSKMKGKAKTFKTDHPKICKGVKVAATAIGTVCTAFTGICVASVIADRKAGAGPEITKTVLNDGTEITNF